VSFFSTPCGAASQISRTLVNRLTGETVYRQDAGEEPRAAPLARWPNPPRAGAISSGRRWKSMFSGAPRHSRWRSRTSSNS